MIIHRATSPIFEISIYRLLRTQVSIFVSICVDSTEYLLSLFCICCRYLINGTLIIMFYLEFTSLPSSVILFSPDTLSPSYRFKFPLFFKLLIMRTWPFFDILKQHLPSSTVIFSPDTLSPSYRFFPPFFKLLLMCTWPFFDISKQHLYTRTLP